jgi:hypothetical protein
MKAEVVEGVQVIHVIEETGNDVPSITWTPWTTSTTADPATSNRA